MKKFLKLMVGILALGVSSGAATVATSCAPSSWTDKIINKAKLHENYAGKSFLSDGIGKVKLTNLVDGDTAHFQSVSGGGTIKVRYNCIDTPESTGMLEPWGKGASNFNKQMLTTAKTIVLSTDSHDQTADKKTAVDSTGGRYLAYVWVSTKENAPYKDLKMINLALCVNGWSKAKGATGKDYSEAFAEAASAAEDHELHVWNPNPDPDFNYAAPTKIDMKMIVDGIGLDGNAFNWIDCKVTFEGEVAICGPDKGAAYLNKDFTWDEGGITKTRRYGLYIFTSYQSYAPLNTVGNIVQVTGTVSSYNGVMQIVGVSYSINPDYAEDDDMKILTKAVDNQNPMQPLQCTAREMCNDSMLNVVVEADLTCESARGTQNTAAATAWSFTLICKDAAGDQIDVRVADSIAIMNPDTGKRVQDPAYFEGKSFHIVGGLTKFVSQYGTTYYEINLCSKTGITFDAE